MTPLLFIEDCTQDIQSFFYKEEGYLIFEGRDGWTMMLDQCSHLGIPLSTGWLEKGCIVCPWHQWTFDEKGGCIWPLSESEKKVPVFSVFNRNGLLWIESVKEEHFWRTFLVPIHWKDLEEYYPNSDLCSWHWVGMNDQTRVWCGGTSAEIVSEQISEFTKITGSIEGKESHSQRGKIRKEER
jgi:phenylpropionate dioxygenase-like ring-hydroxylating dioxygenase large terminal subunit